MTLHKLFKEMMKLDEKERDLLWNTMHEAHTCKRMCEDMGVKFTDKKLAKFIYERYKRNGITPTVCASSPQKGPTLKQVQDIVSGTNLDIIEEAAEKKGLL